LCRHFARCLRSTLAPTTMPDAQWIDPVLVEKAIKAEMAVENASFGWGREWEQLTPDDQALRRDSMEAALRVVFDELRLEWHRGGNDNEWQLRGPWCYGPERRPVEQGDTK
jgi:hypothetical protein